MALLSRRSLLSRATGAFCSITAGVPAHARLIPSWPGGARGAVSLTYDDGLNSQLDYVAPELDRRGLKATFFLTEDNMAGRVADWARVAADGHEVANHTVSHPCALSSYTARRFDRSELEGMEDYLDTNFGASRIRTFAYPCGYLGLGGGDRRTRYNRYQRLLRTHFAGARTTAGGPNRPKDVLADPFHLHAFEPTYDADLVAPAQKYLDETLASGGWAIFVFHDVAPVWRQAGDASFQAHGAILDLIQSKSLWCAPMGEVLGRIEPARVNRVDALRAPPGVVSG